MLDYRAELEMWRDDPEIASCDGDDEQRGEPAADPSGGELLLRQIAHVQQNHCQAQIPREPIPGRQVARRDVAGFRAGCLGTQQDEPDDYVIATGETHSVREFLDEAFGLLDLDWKEYVEKDPRYYRPAEVDLLLGDAGKARRVLGWEPKVNFKELVRLMVEHDFELARQEQAARRDGSSLLKNKTRWGAGS